MGEAAPLDICCWVVFGNRKTPRLITNTVPAEPDPLHFVDTTLTSLALPNARKKLAFAGTLSSPAEVHLNGRPNHKAAAMEFGFIGGLHGPSGGRKSDPRHRTRSGHQKTKQQYITQPKKNRTQTCDKVEYYSLVHAPPACNTSRPAAPLDPRHEGKALFGHDQPRKVSASLAKAGRVRKSTWYSPIMTDPTSTGGTYTRQLLSMLATHLADPRCS